MNRERYRLFWNRLHKSYQRKVYVMFRSYFVSQAKNIPFDSLTEMNYKETVKNNIKVFDLYNVYYRVYNFVGLANGSRIGKNINRDIKNFNDIIFKSEYQRQLFNWIINNVGYRIVSVHAQFIDNIQNLIANGLVEGKTIEEVSREIKALIDRPDFYKWQAMRISRTETTTAANRSAVIAGTSSRIALEKIWISGIDFRVRTAPKSKFDHREMNGKRIPKDDYFNVNGELIEYPGALTTKEGERSSPGNIINCRCTIALVPKRDRNGKIIRL